MLGFYGDKIMRKSLIATLVALAAMTTAAAASGHSDVTLRATGIILGLLHDMGCSSYDSIKWHHSHGGYYKVDDARCFDGKYDIRIDANFQVIGKR